MRISDWSSDVCSSDLFHHPATAQSTYFINSNNKCEWLKHRGVNQSTAHEFLLTPDTSDSKAPFDRAHIPRPCGEPGRAQIVAKSIAKPLHIDNNNTQERRYTRKHHATEPSQTLMTPYNKPKQPTN